MKKPRARDLGLDFSGTPGRHNAITDVPGVHVGYKTIISDDQESLTVGRGPVRTGVTAILPRGRQRDLQPVWAGSYALNGNGELTGTHWIEDGGYFSGPICLTNTHAVGAVHQGTTQWMLKTYAHQFNQYHLWAMPVVGETYDGVLNDINGMHVLPEHAIAAIDAAADGPLEEGNVGGGTGMICYEFKGGTGTSSRRVDIDGSAYTVGALVQANHGVRDWLTILGVPVGKHLDENRLLQKEQGSIIALIGTDIPMLPHQLRRIAKRAAIAIGRGGSPGGNNSGDIFLAFSVANPMPLPQFGTTNLQFTCVSDEAFDPVYLAAVEAVEEAVVNCLVAASSMTTIKPAGKLCSAISHERLVQIMRRHGRCAAA